MRIVTYDPEYGEAIADGRTAARALRWWLSDAESITVASSLFIEALRVLVYKGTIPHDTLEFRFKGEVLRLDADARFDKWPLGFCDYWDRVLETLLDPKAKG